MTPTQVKQSFKQQGKTVTAWAREHGYSRQEVYRVLNGQAKAYYGRAHDIAVALGLKRSAA
jgi:gp16 family phage-associated protein